MPAGVPELGALDAWHKALADIEEMKMDSTLFCGGVADIAKFFEQIRRQVVYRMAKNGGVPTPILAAYTAYIENLLFYNCLAGGVGTPYSRKCGVPQGCPLACFFAKITAAALEFLITQQHPEVHFMSHLGDRLRWSHNLEQLEEAFAV